MQKLNHCISEKDTYDEVNELYNQTFYEKDNRTPSYRKILLIEKNLNNYSRLKKKTEREQKGRLVTICVGNIFDLLLTVQVLFYEKYGCVL